jgi:hypothetical protein
MTVVRAGPRHVGIQGRLIISHPFKQNFLKNLFKIYSVGVGRN